MAFIRYIMEADLENDSKLYWMLKAAGWRTDLLERQGGAFTTWDIQKKFGLKQARLKEWLKFLPPSFKASGPGTKNLFSRTDLYKLFVFRELIEKGLSRERAAEIVNIMARAGLAYSSGSTLLTAAWGLREYEIKESGNGVAFSLTVDFGEVKKIVDGLVE